MPVTADLEQVLRELGIAEEQWEGALSDALYIMALNEVAKSHDELVEIAASLEDDATRTTTAITQEGRGLLGSRWYLFVIDEILKSSKADLMDRTVEVFGLPESEARALRRVVSSFRSLQHALPSQSWLPFPPKPTDPSTVIDAGALSRLISGGGAFLKRRLARHSVIGTIRELVGAPEILGLHTMDDVLGAALPYLDLKRLQQESDRLQEELNQWSLRLGPSATDDDNGAFRDWIDKNYSGLRLLLELIKNDTSPDRAEFPLGGISGRASLAKVTRLHDTLRPLLQRSGYAAPPVRLDDVTPSELRDFVESAVTERVIPALRVAAAAREILDRRYQEALSSLAINESDCDVWEPFCRYLDETGTLWVLAEEEPVEKIKQHLAPEWSEWIDEARRRYVLVVKNWVSIERRRAGRLNSWTITNGRPQFDVRRRVPQTEVRVASGTREILFTRDDADDVLRLARQLLKHSLEAMESSRDLGLVIQEQVKTLFWQGMNDILGMLKGEMERADWRGVNEGRDGNPAIRDSGTPAASSAQQSTEGSDVQNT